MAAPNRRRLLGRMAGLAGMTAFAGFGRLVAANPAPSPLSPSPRPGDVDEMTLTFHLRIDGERVRADLHRPPAGAPWRGGVVLAHGFTRTRATLAGHGRALAAQGVLGVALEMPYTFDFEGNARALRELVAQMRAGQLPVPGGVRPVPAVVLVGFSAGGLSSLLAADAPGVAGYVGLDPFDRLPPDEPGLGARAAPQRTVPSVLLRAGPSRCNAQSAAGPWAGLLPRLQSDTVVPEASHCDFESPSDALCRWACGPTDVQRQAAIQQALVRAVVGFLSST